ncbi:MAG: fibrillarin-like rRNA/tRNA 2'-O-methyltransferase [Thermoproteota archaeon]|nr:fibrillarin-like rRNA/tRNA 2'-O-methyltransferase [Candidatus Brockarchaeota archaeon]MBO3768345.1 fibrillarin-like rRNA/tRNA 2'-O-methyltransferase [Candidatus Brockarchaeota archaeon]MBO3800720.1 fibrillarin-like rRNA/tRNA 2'-O-methyltransferase [Candidatus Brockarchaeota archaeon]
MREIFNNVFEENEKILTINLAPGFSVYGEELVKIESKEYRVWDPYRSKISAAIKNGLKNFPIREDSKILYLGAANGTTVSHVSDVAKNGVVYAVEVAFRPMRDLIEKVAKKRTNVIPILADARKPFSYCYLVENVDLIYADVAQPDQTDIVYNNAVAYLKSGGIVCVAIKASSIDSTKDPHLVVDEEIKKMVKNGFELIERLDLEPFDKAHEMVVCRWK